MGEPRGVGDLDGEGHEGRAAGAVTHRAATIWASTKGGVLISAVEPGSFAEDINLRRGDVPVEINRQPVNTVDDVRRMQNSLKPGDAVAFRVLRQAGRGGDWQSVFLAGVLPNNHP